MSNLTNNPYFHLNPTLNMNKPILVAVFFFVGIGLISSCSKNDTIAPTAIVDPYVAIKSTFGTAIDFTSLNNYASQTRPAYILNDNSGANPISDKKATLGRALFYDKNLSINNTISCGSCHLQAFAFGDTSITSDGVLDGQTVRHSMRLVNTRFSNEAKFFWNERAASLEIQTTMPIQDHAEMGFSGVNGRANLTALLNKLASINYYKELFNAVYGDTIVTEIRMQESMAQFIRSIQSFDSKFDAGRSQVNNDNNPFPNFTAQENAGKNLFLAPPVFDGSGNRIAGGLGCNGCHKAPEFDIDPNTRNNGIVGTIGSSALDLANTKAPSLRNLIRPDGIFNGQMMHTGQFKTFEEVLGHYNNVPNIVGNNNLDARLRVDNIGNKLQLTQTEINAVVAFMKTLSGTAVYTDTKWSNPFLVK